MINNLLKLDYILNHLIKLNKEKRGVRSSINKHILEYFNQYILVKPYITF